MHQRIQDGSGRSVQMRLISWLPIGLLAAGIALVTASVANGETDVSLVLIFPILSGSSVSFLLGTALIVIGLLAGFLTMWTAAPWMAAEQARERANNADAEEGGGRQIGGVVLIGPIPIAFGSSSKIAYAMLAVGGIIVLIALALVLLSLL